MDLSFYKFLEEICTATKKYVCYGDEIVLIVNEKETVIATKIPKVEYINVVTEDETIYVELGFTLEDEDRETEVNGYVEDLKRGNIIVEPEDIQENLEELYKKKWMENKQELISLFTRYTKYYIKNYLKTHYSVLAYCGWKTEEEGKEFYSLTKRTGGNFPYIRDMFGWDIYQMYRSREEFPYILDKFNQCRELYDLLFKNPVLIDVFAYTLHAMTLDYLYGYMKENYYICDYPFWEDKNVLFFSICIHGKDIDKAKLIANLFCNLFNAPKDRWTKISLLHHISATSLKAKVEKLRKYSSVPIIITSKTNHITKSAKILKDLHHNRENMQLFIYPVYINDTSINVDEIVNCDIDGVNLPFPVKDREMACTIYKQVTMMLYSFVLYLRDKSIEGKSIRTDAEEDFEQEWVEDNASEFWLYTALKSFCDFLKPYQREEGEKLLSVYRKSIMNTGETEEPEQQIQAIKSDAQQRQRYLLYYK